MPIGDASLLIHLVVLGVRPCRSPNEQRMGIVDDHDSHYLSMEPHHPQLARTGKDALK